MITIKDVEKISELARIKLTEEEKIMVQKDLSSILNYINKLEELDVEKVNYLNYLAEKNNIAREDKAKSFENKKEIINAFSEKEKNYLKVKSILS